MATVFTIGHSTHPINEFVDLLQRHGVTALADVRSAPYSRRQPQFNREALAREVETREIRYVYLGKELGGRRNGRHDAGPTGTSDRCGTRLRTPIAPPHVRIHLLELRDVLFRPGR